MKPPDKWHLKTEGGIRYTLYENNPRGSFNDVDGEITEQILIESENFVAFVEESFSHYTVSGNTWSFRGARRYPQNSFRTVGVDFEPFPRSLPGDPLQIDAAAADGTYGGFLLLTVKYSSGINQDDEYDWQEIQSNATGEFISYQPDGSWVWFDLTGEEGAEEGAENPAPATVILPGVEWNVKFRPVPWDAMTRVTGKALDLLGCVNSDAISLLGGAEEETVMFAGFGMRTRWTWKDVKPYCDLDMKFLQKRIVLPGGYGGSDQVLGHNHFFNPKTGRWQKLLVPPDGWIGFYRNVYRKAELSPLFTVRS